MDELMRGMLEIRHDETPAQAAYDEIYTYHGIRKPDRFVNWLLELAALRPGMRLLDVACGQGQLPRLAEARGAEAHGVDFSPVAVRLGGPMTGRLLLAVADGEVLPYAAGSFDRVTSIGSLEHYIDPRRGVEEIARVLKGDGLALVLLPNSFGLRWNVLHTWHHGDIHDDGQPLQRYGTRQQWVRLLAAGGLVVERVVGYEGTVAGRLAWLRAVRHPSRLLIPLARWMPVNMASMFIFLCRRADGG